MAGVSTKEIKNRIRSMEATKQITRAMEMVAASKMRKTQTQVAATRPYFESLRGVIENIVAANRDFSSPYLVARPVKQTVYLVIAGDRGLAGGYNSNLLKMVMAHMEGKNAKVLPIGKKAVEFFKARGVEVLTDAYAHAETVSMGDCFTIAKSVAKQYLKGDADELFIAYTNLESVLSQIPTVIPMLPLERPQTSSIQPDIVYEPNSVEVFDAIIPEYLGGVLYGALCESRASEQAARRTAMDAATQNAEEMIGQLSLDFNRARQAAITQEITEIVAGA